MMKTKIFITWIAFLLGTLTTLHAQHRLAIYTGDRSVSTLTQIHEVSVNNP